MKKMILGEVSLRKLDASDNHIIAAMANNRKVWDNITDVMPHPYSESDADDFISMALIL